MENDRGLGGHFCTECGVGFSYQPGRFGMCSTCEGRARIDRAFTSRVNPPVSDPWVTALFAAVDETMKSSFGPADVLFVTRQMVGLRYGDAQAVFWPGLSGYWMLTWGESDLNLHVPVDHPDVQVVAVAFRNALATLGYPGGVTSTDRAECGRQF